MTCRGFRHVLALLPDGEAELRAVYERAVALAQSERARLTLAKTTDPGWVVRWCCPLAALSRVPPMTPPDFTAIAERRLASLAESVPASISLCTVVLGPKTAQSLRRLAAHHPYDLVVLSAGQLAHDLTLRRQLRRLGVCTLAVTAEASSELVRAPEAAEADRSSPGDLTLTSTSS